MCFSNILWRLQLKCKWVLQTNVCQVPNPSSGSNCHRKWGQISFKKMLCHIQREWKPVGPWGLNSLSEVTEVTRTQKLEVIQYLSASVNATACVLPPKPKHKQCFSVLKKILNLTLILPAYWSVDQTKIYLHMSQALDSIKIVACTYWYDCMNVHHYSPTQSLWSIYMISVHHCVQKEDSDPDAPKRIQIKASAETLCGSGG